MSLSNATAPDRSSFMLLRRFRTFPIASLVVSLGALGAAAATNGCSHDEPAAAPTLDFRGTYEPTGPGPISQVTFWSDRRYELRRDGCANGRCAERGTYAFDPTSDVLRLTNERTGQVRVLPVRVRHTQALGGGVEPRGEALIGGSTSLIVGQDDAGAAEPVDRAPIVESAAAGGQPIERGGAPPTEPDVTGMVPGPAPGGAGGAPPTEPDVTGMIPGPAPSTPGPVPVTIPPRPASGTGAPSPSAGAGPSAFGGASPAAGSPPPVPWFDLPPPSPNRSGSSAAKAPDPIPPAAVPESSSFQGWTDNPPGSPPTAPPPDQRVQIDCAGHALYPTHPQTDLLRIERYAYGTYDGSQMSSDSPVCAQPSGDAGTAPGCAAPMSAHYAMLSDTYVDACGHYYRGYWEHAYASTADDVSAPSLLGRSAGSGGSYGKTRPVADAEFVFLSPLLPTDDAGIAQDRARAAQTHRYDPATHLYTPISAGH